MDRGRVNAGTAERRLNALAGPTGWKVRWNDGWFWTAVGMYHNKDYPSVILESPDGGTWINAGTTMPAHLESHGRDFVFACALADFGGKARPDSDFKNWIWPCAVAGPWKTKSVPAPEWLMKNGECLVNSAEEFMFKLSMYSYE